jgi:hypothetical protein
MFISEKKVLVIDEVVFTIRKGATMYFILKTATAVIFAAIFFCPLFATETRVATMGGNGYYMRDNSNIFVFPGTFYQYKKQAIAELRLKNNDQYYSVGVHIPVDTVNVLGVYLNRPLSIAIPAVGFLEHVRLDRVTDLFYGRKLADYDLGLNASLGFDTYSDESSVEDEPKISEGIRYFALNGGISNEKMDLGIKFDLPSASRDVDSLTSTVNGYNLRVVYRYFYQWKNKIELLPLGILNYGSATQKQDIANQTEDVEVDYGNLTFGAGLGLNFHLNEKNLMVLGIEGIGYYKNTTETKDGPKNTYTVMTLPGIYFGIESRISKWFLGRLGAAQVHQRISQKSEMDDYSSESVSYQTQFRMAFGLGITFGKFLLDASVNEGLLFDGPNFISGTTEPMTNRLSLTYAF